MFHFENHKSYATQAVQTVQAVEISTL
jgi:cell shape-determining protein MreC